MNKVYYDFIPDFITMVYPNFYYNKINKILEINENIECNTIISNITKMYLLYGDFYIHSKLYLILLWPDERTYSIIKK